jgi:hypothetical protein
LCEQMVLGSNELDAQAFQVEQIQLPTVRVSNEFMRGVLLGGREAFSADEHEDSRVMAFLVNALAIQPELDAPIRPYGIGEANLPALLVLANDGVTALIGDPAERIEAGVARARHKCRAQPFELPVIGGPFQAVNDYVSGHCSILRHGVRLIYRAPPPRRARLCHSDFLLTRLTLGLLSLRGARLASRGLNRQS